jgi:hypothetical protein
MVKTLVELIQQIHIWFTASLKQENFAIGRETPETIKLKLELCVICQVIFKE